MNEQTRNEIVRRSLSGQSQRSIARQLGMSRPTVRRVIEQYHRRRDEAGADCPELPRKRASRRSLLDPFRNTVGQLLARYPNITITRLLEELRAGGYQGGYTILRQYIRTVRGPSAKALVERFETAPGVQAQMDWSTYDIDFTAEGRRRVQLFSYLLAYSRRQYLHFTKTQDMETTLREHIHAFRHLGGVAATCLYDNMKVVVTRWEDEHPIYNARFLAFATHYGYQPRACRPRRPETKGKVERPFLYVETSLLNGRTFRSLEHLNEVTRWWLDNVADVRVHRTTKKRPIDAHAEELPRLLPLPPHDYDTSRVVYRLVEQDGFVRYLQNLYSAPWRYLGQTVPVRINEQELTIYNLRIEPVARHILFPAGVTGQKRCDPSHRPPRDQHKQLELLREQFAQWGETGKRFLEGLLAKHRHGKALAARVLSLTRSYRQQDVLAAMERAVRYQAFSLASLERILATQAEPKKIWPTLDDSTLEKLGNLPPVSPRPTADYQHLLFSEEPDDEPIQNPQEPPPNPPQEPESQDNTDRSDPRPPRDAPNHDVDGPDERADSVG